MQFLLFDMRVQNFSNRLDLGPKVIQLLHDLLFDDFGYTPDEYS